MYRDLQGFHEELNAKRDVIDRMSARCRRMLLESPSEEEPSTDVDLQLSTVRDQIDALCRLSDKRLVASRLSVSGFLSVQQQKVPEISGSKKNSPDGMDSVDNAPACNGLMYR